MVIVRYYVSQQNGNDVNDGLSPQTAWKSITAATQAVPVPTGGDTIIVHIGPGTYRERPVPLNSGASASSKIIYQGDPYAIYNTNDKPGRVRITGCDGADIPTQNHVINWSSKSNLELQHVFVDGSSDGYACYNVPVCRNVHATGFSGFYSSAGCLHYNCVAIVKEIGFYNVQKGKQYNCVAVSGKYGFYSNGNSANAANGMLHQSCFGIGGTAAFYATLHYDAQPDIVCDNCVAYCSPKGFYTYTGYALHKGTNCKAVKLNCLAICCNIGFYDLCYYNAGGGYSTTNFTYTYDCTYFYCTTGYASERNYNTNVITNSTAGPNTRLVNAASLKHICLDLSYLIPSFVFRFGMEKQGFIHNYNYTSGTSVDLSTERFIPFTPNVAGRSVGVQIRATSLSASGNITVALQKYVEGTWVAQKSKQLAVQSLKTTNQGFNLFLWDTGDGDDMLTTQADTWRYSVTADENATATVLAGVSAGVPTTVGHCVPTGMLDVRGNAIHGPLHIGGGIALDAFLDTAMYHTVSPGIKIIGAGEKTFKLPVEKDAETTVTYQVYHDGAAAGYEPQIRVEHQTLTTVVDTHASGANSWDLLSITFTPSFTGEVNIIIANRDVNKNAWFSDPAVV